MAIKKKYIPDLERLGALHEGNYRRLVKLFNIMAGEDQVEFNLNIGNYFVGKVAIQLLESCKYTDTFLLEQVTAAGKWVNNPKMVVRLYHDATVAEVMSSCGNRTVQPIQEYPNKLMYHPDEKAQLNTFLSEWLNFCLKYGCCFVSPYATVRPLHE